MPCSQGRNEGRQWGHNSPGAKSLWGRRKGPTMSQVLSSIQYIRSGKSSASNMGGAPNLLRPCLQCTPFHQSTIDKAHQCKAFCCPKVSQLLINSHKLKHEVSKTSLLILYFMCFLRHNKLWLYALTTPCDVTGMFSANGTKVEIRKLVKG